LDDKSLPRKKILQFARVLEGQNSKKSGLNFFIQKNEKSLPRKISGYAPVRDVVMLKGSSCMGSGAYAEIFFRGGVQKFF